MGNPTGEHTTECMVCGAPLVYASEAREHECMYCGNTSKSPIVCSKGHFVCDSCHSANALSFLDRMAESERSVDPRAIAEIAFRHPSFKFHGPEHHSLVPAAILITLKNRGITGPDGRPINAHTVKEGIRRGSAIPGGFCGYAGDCGACVGAGIAVALFLGSTPKRAYERKQAHRATVEALTLGQDGLIRCCKRSTLYGITAAMRFLREEYGIDLGNVPEPESCQQSSRNPDCERDACGYFVRSAL